MEQVQKTSVKIVLILGVVLFIIAAFVIMAICGVFYKKYEFASGNGTKANPFQISSVKNILKYNYCVSNPTTELLEGYNEAPVGWYSVEEEHAESDTYVGNSSVTLEELCSAQKLEGFLEYNGEAELENNKDCVWIFEENCLPSLYWEH